MTLISPLMTALSVELEDIARRLVALQDVPLLQSETGAALNGEELLRAMMALQDLDRLAQTAAALATFTGQLGDGRDAQLVPAAVEDAMRQMSLHSLADRLRQRLGPAGIAA